MSIIAGKRHRPENKDPGDGDGMGSPPENPEKLLVDTLHISRYSYPNDLGLLNEAREKSESHIDQLHKCYSNKYPVLKKPRTGRRKVSSICL